MIDNKSKNNKNNTSKKDETFKLNYLKPFLIICLVLFGIVFIIANNDNKAILKPEYKIGEKATIDDIDLKLTNVKYINKKTGIEITFEITNRQANTITIKPDEYFKLYDVNKVQIPNKFENDKNIAKRNEKIIYKLQYNIIKKEIYEIYFYSQIAENNIKFTFNTKDIMLDDVTTGGSVKKEEKTIE